MGEDYSLKGAAGGFKSLADARALLAQGRDGRYQLEDFLGYPVCSLNGCIYCAGHAGECFCTEITASKRKRKPKVHFEAEESVPQPKKSKGPRRGFARDAAASSQLHAAAPRQPPAQAAPPSQSTALVVAPSTRLAAQMDADTVDAVPNMRTAPDFLSTFKQAHPNPFSPIADVADNSLEAKSTVLQIDLKTVSHCQVLTLADDGIGMSEKGVTDYLSIGYTNKQGSHYGFGGTTSMCAIADHSLVFSRANDHHFTVGCLSSELNKVMGREGKANQTKTPVCTWDVATGRVLDDSGRRGEEQLLSDYKARCASLQLILKISPFQTEEELLGDFLRRMGRSGSRGTMLMMWGGLGEKYRVGVAAQKDILNRKAPDDAKRYDVSLRAFLSLLYYQDDFERVPMRIQLMGKLVEYRNWSSFLHLAEKYTYKPQKVQPLITFDCS